MSQIRLRPSRIFSGQFQDLKYRVLRAMENRRNGGGMVLTFVSCYPGEGVTTVAANFATSMASDAKQRVLLIDGDLRSPSLQGLLEKSPGKGLPPEPQAPHVADSNLLWRVTPVNKNLDMLMVHQTQKNPTVIFEAAWFNNRLNSIRQRYDFIVIDSPPLNASSGSLVLSSKADGLILVVQAGRVRRQVIQRNIDVLLDTRVNILGVVMNKRTYPIPSFIYKRL